MSTTALPEPPLSELDREAEKLPDFNTDHPCPSYCNLPCGHPVDSIESGPPVRTFRGHGGPDAEFGPHVSGGSSEYSDEPGVFHTSVWVVVEKDIADPEELITLARNVCSAAEWLIEQQGGRA